MFRTIAISWPCSRLNFLSKKKRRRKRKIETNGSAFLNLDPSHQWYLYYFHILNRFIFILFNGSVTIWWNDYRNFLCHYDLLLIYQNIFFPRINIFKKERNIEEIWIKEYQSYHQLVYFRNKWFGFTVGTNERLFMNLRFIYIGYVFSCSSAWIFNLFPQLCPWIVVHASLFPSRNIRFHCLVYSKGSSVSCLLYPLLFMSLILFNIIVTLFCVCSTSALFARMALTTDS